MDTPTLQQFLRQDFLKSSHFLFQMPIAPVMRNLNMREFSYFCEAVEFPGKTVQTVDYKIAGTNRIKIPYSRDFNEITTTFIHNNSIPVYEFFCDWIETSFGGVPTVNNAYYDDCIVDYNLYQFSTLPYGNTKKFGGLNNILNSIDKINSRTFESSSVFKFTDIVQTFVNKVNALAPNAETQRASYYDVKIIGAYPTNVASMPSNWADEGYHRLNVTWTYERFTINNKEYSSAGQTDYRVNQITDYIDNLLSSSSTGNSALDQTLDLVRSGVAVDR